MSRKAAEDKPVGRTKGGASSGEERSGGSMAGEATNGGIIGQQRLTEVDREWFVIQIQSLQAKLMRRNQLCFALDAANQTLKSRYEELRQDKLDVVCYLKRLLRQRTDLIVDLDRRHQALQAEFDDHMIASSAKVKQLEKEQNKAEEAMNAEIQVLTKKLDALEEFRIRKQHFAAKLEEMEEANARNEQECQYRLAILEKKRVLHEDKLKTEMMANLEEVAADFRHASLTQMRATTRRTLRENCSVSAQVGRLSAQLTIISATNKSQLDEIQQLHQQIRILQAQQTTLLRSNAHRLTVIHEIAAELRKIKKGNRANMRVDTTHNHVDMNKDGEGDEGERENAKKRAVEKDELSLYHQPECDNLNENNREASQLEHVDQPILDALFATMRVVSNERPGNGAGAERDDVIHSLLNILNEAQGCVKTAAVNETTTTDTDEARQHQIEYVTGQVGMLLP